MVIYKYFNSLKKKTLSCFGIGLILHCISSGLDFSNFFLVFQFWTLKFFINAGQWQSPLGIFGNFFLVLAQITLTFYSHCLLYYTMCTLKKKFFFFFKFSAFMDCQRTLKNFWDSFIHMHSCSFMLQHLCLFHMLG